MNFRLRRIALSCFALVGTLVWLFVNPASYEEAETTTDDDVAVPAVAEVTDETTESGPKAIDILEKLAVKGRAPKTGYSREEFYNGWPTIDGCNLRQRIIKRDFGDTAVLDGCTVISGEYLEPYTGKTVVFTEKSEISSKVQIDHVVALSDAWQKGAQYMDKDVRYQIATDPLNLLAVDSSANQQKSDGDAATWLPKNKKFRCEYVARQVSVKYKYSLWVTKAEKEAILRILEKCPNEPAIGI
ncbi:MAG: HNH endonuclease family protein [Candidatus Saccharibacteria bacterium]|nr:HNH endonuclease family protein [Candidatus Saccharibacteria bacterium]